MAQQSEQEFKEALADVFDAVAVALVQVLRAGAGRKTADGADPRMDAARWRAREAASKISELLEL